MLPTEVQALLAEWNGGEISRGEFTSRLVHALTPTNVDEVMAALTAMPDDVFDDVVAEGRSIPRRGEPQFSIRSWCGIGSPPPHLTTYPPDEAIVAFDDWHRRTFRREARGPVDKQLDHLVGELHALVETRRVTEAAYTTALQIALGLVPTDAPDREALLRRVRWYEPWIDWTDPKRTPPGLKTGVRRWDSHPRGED